jgi:hypothetical protein
MESKICNVCDHEFNMLQKQRIFMPCGDVICMTCFEEHYVAETQSILCSQCGDQVSIPPKLKDNVDKLKSESKIVWILCDQHRGHVA